MTSNIEMPAMVPLLVEASPSFAETWRQFQVEWACEHTLPFHLALADFVRHMSHLLASGDEATLHRIFSVIERFHVEGASKVREAATVGLLEDLQNANLHDAGTSPEQFERFLLPVSARYWRKVEAFWAEGKLITDD
jgi:hypothetical protein